MTPSRGWWQAGRGNATPGAATPAQGWWRAGRGNATPGAATPAQGWWRAGRGNATPGAATPFWSWWQACRRTGMHVTRRPHLLVVSARTVDYLRHNELAADPEALHWLGWNEALVRPASSLPLTARLPLVAPDWALPPTRHRIEFTAVARGSLALAGQLGIRRVGEDHHVGGVMRKDFRGRGLGTQFLTEVMRLAHKHFGLRRVLAGCERDNTASMRWLAKSGFEPMEGPETYLLDNGREAKTLWWQHVDETARLRCPLLL